MDDPELVRRWWNARRGEMTVAEIDLRVGGRWRYAMATPDGREVAFHGWRPVCKMPSDLLEEAIATL
jgi:uncharacterized protein YndB with AHSA1/START domain